MIKGIVDTNILIELYRKLPAAQTWIAGQADLAVTIVSWLEFLEGARGKAGQARCLQIIASFELVLLTADDQQWTKTQLVNYRLSHGLSYKDCLIASSVYRLQVPLFTHNIKDFLPILPSHLVLKPWQ